MDKMEWAVWGLEYLQRARLAIHDDFNAAMEELRGYHTSHRESWYSSCKNIISTLYHRSAEITASTQIPNEEFASPDSFESELVNYRAWLLGMAEELKQESENYRRSNDVDGAPFLVDVANRHVHNILAAVDYVLEKQPAEIPNVISPETADLNLIVGLARRFHEAALSLNHHPHNGTTLEIKNEWDCQYLFRSILAAYVPDIRDEEWSSSVAGSSARCEFFLKSLRAMIELKFARKPTDAKKIKGELAVDFLDYGGNDEVDRVICLIYDPACTLKNPAAIQSDLSGPKTGLERVDVVISPPRS
ncbi:PD-(D/E)XK nuclease domain-containing protein [Pseudophaeobacter flagellatus]|uniref:PD-(D/E)XK nuclease domain-containing protein n=1 Tax=Pseudophaeobacter flagellatus TaxID=2899119 RepID=UPI001E527368|nr:hypothetical protein [Pseudophaeobacter flagellatus]MCD9148974.1 hypothetical protein [Pseudophaeobacter flagellatus]